MLPEELKHTSTPDKLDLITKSFVSRLHGQDDDKVSNVSNLRIFDYPILQMGLGFKSKMAHDEPDFSQLYSPKRVVVVKQKNSELRISNL